ncbi:MAG: hypothetical protein WB524_09895 [Acidobacteriaceae bacterium]|jgi:putative membrane protein (TIGR04086 family)
MSRLSIKGAVLGGIVDVGSSFVLAIPVAIWIVFRHGLNHHPARIPESPGLSATNLIVGLFTSVLGGFVAARIARHDELLNGAASSWLCLLLAIVSIVIGLGNDTLVHKLLMLPAGPICGLFGGYLSHLRRQPVKQAA